MSFLFKSKKNHPPPSSLPAATRNVHTSDGTPGPSVKDDRGGPINGAGGPNGSMNSINSIPGQHGAAFGRRERSESEVGTRPANLMQQVPHAALYPWSQRQLTFRNPQANPFPRYGAAVNSVASKEGDIYMMGGLINGSSVKGDLWMFEGGPANISCSPITTLAEGPGPRVGHSSLLVGNAFIVFGGDTKIDENDTLDDTLYLLNTSSRQWSRASPPGPRPSGRYGHTLNIVGSKIYIFGGQVEGSFYNDLIAFDLNQLQNPSNQWEFLISNTGEQSVPTVPPARTNHSVITYNDQLYLFGGTNGMQWFNDVWTYDPRVNRWTQLDCIGYIPAAREGHAAAIVSDVMYIFGGRNEDGNDLGDLAAFRVSLRRWYTFQNMGPSPSPRSGHSMTARGKEIFILGGEPSAAPRDAGELSLAYILDTSKIRYPNDAPGGAQSQKALNGPPSPTRRPSSEAKHAIATRSASREGHHVVPNNALRNDNSRDVMTGGPVQRPSSRTDGPGPAQSSVPINNQPTRIPRSSISQTQPGPPPQNQAPAPRQNGMSPPANPSKMSVQVPLQEQVRPPPVEVITANPQPAHPAVKEVQQQHDPVRLSREGSPVSQGRRTPNQGSISKAKAMETGEAAPLVGAGVARQRSLRSQRAHTSIESTEDVLGHHSGRRRSDTPSQRNSRTFADEPKSPKVSPHQEALIKELEMVKNKNAWYASELALARKAGFTAAASPTMDDRSTTQFADEDRPLVEAFIAMRSELVKMQSNMEQQAAQTAKKIAEVEHQRDAAVTEAAYSRAKLAAHGGSQRSTPQLDAPRASEDSDRATEISRRLALALAATNEHKAKIESLNDQINAERRAKEIAEETAEAAQKRLDKLDQGQNHGELEALKAELHEAQSIARNEAGQRVEAEQKLRMLEVDHSELTEKHRGISGQVSEHNSSLAALEAAVDASTTKVGVYERQLEEEKMYGENLEIKLGELKAEYEKQAQELESVVRKHRDAEQLAETHAREATTHREALVAGLSKLSNPDRTTSRDSLAERRLAALHKAAEEANELAKTNKDAADATAQKLRSAEERIAGLEAYQEQTSREGLQIRRQLQAALRDVQTHQNHNRTLSAQLETVQRDASALSVQHGALKDLLGERGIDHSNTRRSPGFDIPGSPDQTRLRELQQQLEMSVKAHDETKAMMESSQQETERTFREKLEQLENDYQSLLTYVRGTEKMLKKMKEELTKYKNQNQKLTSDLEQAKDTSGTARGLSESDSDWAAERVTMQQSIDSIKNSTSAQIEILEGNLASIQNDLSIVRAERDQQKSTHEKLLAATQQRDKELTQLRTENSMLESRAKDAEHRVNMLLDQVGQSIGDMRRRSQMPPQHAVESTINGHDRGQSISTMTDTSSHHEGDDADHRGSLTLDHLASELETLRTQWENTSRSYRLSDKFDFEKGPPPENSGTGMSDSLANWRKKLAEEENKDAQPGPSVAATTNKI